MKRLFLLIFPVFFVACSSDSNNAESSTLEADTAEAEPTLLVHFAKVPTLPLPLNFDESYFRNINTSGFVAIPDSIQPLMVEEHDEEAEYYFVSRYAINNDVEAVLIFESKIDLNFNAEERFFLNTFNRDSLINSIIFAASVSEEDHFKTLGKIDTDTSVSTVKYSYKWRDGRWQKVEQPLKIATYEITPDGSIEPMDTEIHIEDNEEAKTFS